MTKPLLSYDPVLNIILESGSLLRPHFGISESIDQKSISPCDVVTALDREVEIFIADKLRKLDSTIEMVGEEFGGNKDAEKYWSLDPIDGTGHFMRGIPFCTTMLALVIEGKVLFSCIYNFITNEMYSASKDEGATLNGEVIRVSERELKDAYLTHHIDLRIPTNLEIFKAIRTKAILFNSISSGFEYTLLASGKTDGKISLNATGGDYDFTAGGLLIEEAGGVIRNIDSDTYDFKDYSFIAADPKVFEEVKDLMNLISQKSNSL